MKIHRPSRRRSGQRGERSKPRIRAKRECRGFAPIPGEPKVRRDATEDVPTSRAKERERLSVAGGFERSENAEGFAPIPGEPKVRRDATEDVPTSRAKERERLSVAGRQGFEPR